MVSKGADVRTSNFSVLVVLFPILILLLSSIQSSLATDPLTVDNGDYTYTSSWAFEDLTNYTLNNVTASNGELNLTLNNYFWNQSSEVDFAKGQRSNVVSGDGIATSSDDIMLGYLRNQNFTSSYYWNLTNGSGSNVFASWSPSEEGVLSSTFSQNITLQVTVQQPDDVSGIDTYINENSASTNYGGGTSLRVQRGVRDRRALLWFDLSSISDTKILDAQLELYMYSSEDASSLDISAHRITNSWAEMSATWDDRNGVSSWTSSGGDFDPLAFDTILGLTNVFGWKSWNITTLADGWVNGTYNNFGVLLDAPSGSTTWKEFYSSDYTTASFRPILRVTYYPLNTFNETSSLTQSFSLTDSTAYRDVSVSDFGYGSFYNSTTIPGWGGQVVLGSEAYFQFEPMENVSYWSFDSSTMNKGSFQLSNTIFIEGAGSMMVDYNLPGASKIYGVKRNAITSWDWSRFTDISLWVRSSGQGEIMKVLLDDSWGTSWTSSPIPLSSEWANYTLSLSGVPCDLSSLDTIRLHFTDTTLPTTTYVDNITLLGGAPYFPEGTFTSRVFDGGYPVQWEKIIWEEGTPGGTSLEIFTRTGNASIPDVSWSAWSSPYSTSQGSIISSPKGRYIQYGINLSTPTSAITPYLSDVILVKTEYNLTYKYSVDAFENITWANLFLELNGQILWEKSITCTSPVNMISFNMGRYFLDTGNYEIRLGLTVEANTTNPMNITVAVDDLQIQGPIGFFLSQIYDAGSEALWQDAVWDAEFYPTTNLSLNIRTSMDNITWNSWMGPLSYPTYNISYSLGRYIQYRVNFTTDTLWLSPVFKSVNITYLKYAPLGTLTFTTDIVAANVTNWGTLSENCTKRGQNIIYEYSIDSGLNWNPISGNLNLSSVSTFTNTIRFRVILETTNTSLTPTLYSFNHTYSVNNPPVIVGTVLNQIYLEDSAPWSIDLTFFESDNEDSGDKLRWFITGENTSLYLLEGEYSSDDVLTFTPQPDAFGNNLVTLWIEDSHGAKTSQPLWINLTSVNDAPEIMGVIPSYDKYENDPNWQIDLSGYKYDRDDPPAGLSWSALGWDIALFDSVIIAGDIITFDLKTDSWGNDEINIILTDGNLLDSQNIWVNVTVVNRPPIINGTIPGFDKMEDDPSWVLDLTINETDREDGSPSANLVWNVLGVDTSLLSFSISDNNVTFTLVPNAYGTNEITLMLEDSQGLTDTQKIWINVTSENDAPQITGTIPDFDKNEDAPNWNYDLSGLRYDVDNSSGELSWQIVGWDPVLFDSVSIVGDILSFDLVQDAFGSDVITIILSDGLLTESRNISVNVTSVNDAPSIMGSIPDFYKNEDDASWILNLTSYESDVEDNYPSSNLSWNVLGVDLNLLTITISDNNLTFTLKPDAFGSNTITIILTDGNSASDSQDILVDVTPENDAPEIYGIIPCFEKNEDAINWNFNLSNYKSDVDSPLSSLSWGIFGVDPLIFDSVIILGDVITFDLAQNAYGNDEITIVLSDGFLPDSQVIWVNVSSVNDAPQILGLIPDFLRNEDDLPWTWELTFNEWDSEDPYPSSSLSWSVAGVDSDIMSVTIIDNNITFTLKPEAFGDDMITIILTDSQGLSDSKDIWVNVTSINDAPIISGIIPSFEKNEDSPNWQLDLSSYKYDVDNLSGELSWQITGWDVSLFNTISLVGDILTFDLASNAFGSDLITITLEDFEYSDSQIIWVNVTEVNDAPVIRGIIPSFVRNEDAPSWSMDLTSNETDVEDTNPSSQLTWSVSNVDLNLLSVTVSDNNLTFTLTPDAFGSDEITIILTDSQGSTDFQNIWVNVTSQNDAPRIIGVIPSYEKEEDANSWNLDLSPYKSDADDPVSTLTWSIVGWDLMLFNSVNLIGDILSFDLASNAFGNNEITLILDDGSLSDSQSIWVNITSINDAPQILYNILDIQRDEDSPGWILDLTSYEHDVEDGSPSTSLTWSISNVDFSLISIAISDNNLTFDLIPNASGKNYITITLTDSGGLSVSQLILIDILPVNDEPIINSAFPNIVLDEDTSITIDLSGNGSDVEDTPSQLKWSISGANMSLYSWQIDPVSNLFQIIPLPNAYGTDTTTLTLIDTDGAIAEKTIQIVIIPVNDQPYIYPQIPQSFFETLEDEAISVLLTSFENDIEDSGDLLIWEVKGATSSIIRVTLDLDNDELFIVPMVIFSSENTQNVETQITLILWDSGGLSAQQNLTVKIIPVNNAPVIEDLPDLMIKYDESYVFDISPYIFDEDTDLNDLILTTSEPSEDGGKGYIDIDGLNLTLYYPVTKDTFAVLIRMSDGHLFDYAIMQVSVSDHSPPQVQGQIPDVYFDEDSGKNGAFNLDDYFGGQEEGTLNFTYYLEYSAHGDDYILVTINNNNSVDFFSARDWYGIERITFRAEDDYGAIVEYTITVTVNPINDPPVISGLPDQECKVNVTKELDLDPFIYDVDTQTASLMIATDSPNIIIQGHNLIFSYDDITMEFVTIMVNDGFAQDTIMIQVTASANQPPSISSIPDLMVKGSDVYLFSLLPYVIDIDNDVEDLTIWTDSPYITPNAKDNMLLQIDFPTEMIGSEVTITIFISDGLDSNSSQMLIKITDELVPTLISNLPNLLFEEDFIFVNAIYLNDYFQNATDFEYFGNENVIIAIVDNWVSLSAVENWSGTEYVTFRGTLGDAFVEDTIEVVVKPVDDPPVLSQLPSYNKMVDEIWNLNLIDYIYDIDTPVTKMSISVDSPYVIQYAMNIYFQYQSSIFDNITVTLSDGVNIVSGNILVTVTADNNPPTYIGLLSTARIKPGEIWSIDLDNYFYDRDGNRLTFVCNKEDIIINPVTHIASWTPKDEDDVLEGVVFTASDGYETVESSPIDVRIEKEKAAPSFWEQYWWLLLLIALIVSVIIVVAMLGRPQEEEEETKYEIDEDKAISYLATKGGGGNYLIRSESSDSAYKVFSGLLQTGFEGLCITTKPPEELTDNYELGTAWIIRLTLRGQKGVDGEGGETRMMGLLAIGDEERGDEKYMFSSNFNTIVETIEDFLMGGDHKVVLLDGLEYILGGEELIMYIGFIASVRERLKDRNSCLLIPIDPKTLSEKEMRLLERETEHLEKAVEEFKIEKVKDLGDLSVAHQKAVGAAEDSDIDGVDLKDTSHRND